MEEIQNQFEDINTRLDENDNNQQDFSDTLDSSLNDIQTNLDDQSQNIDELKNNSGQLTFPLSQDTIDLITELFPRGTITLSGGTATLIDGRISENTVILHSVITPVAHTITLSGSSPYTFNLLTYSVSITKGQAVFLSSDSSDTSTLGYLLL